jgi:chemotaxis signal transduction protein
MNQPLDHCWRRIGVQGGDHSCERLPQVLHCRNCPVFSAAARTLLDRESAARPAGEGLALNRGERGKESALVFRLGKQWLGLPPAMVVEVAANPPVRRLAHRTNGRIEGLVNVRGELRLCVSLVEALGLGRRGETDNRARLLLVDDDGQVLAFRCDEMQGLANFNGNEREPPPDTLPGALRQCIGGMVRIENLHVALIDAKALTLMLRQVVFA